MWIKNSSISFDFSILNLSAGLPLISKSPFSLSQVTTSFSLTGSQPLFDVSLSFCIPGSFSSFSSSQSYVSSSAGIPSMWGPLWYWWCFKNALNFFLSFGLPTFNFLYLSVTLFGNDHLYSSYNLWNTFHPIYQHL